MCILRASAEAGLAQAVAQTRPPPLQLPDRVADVGRVDVKSARQVREERLQRRRQVNVGHQSTITASTDEIAGR